MCVCYMTELKRNDGNCMGVRYESCLYFAEMSIYFRFGEFRANSICPIFREGHAEFLYDFDACMRGYNSFAYTT